MSRTPRPLQSAATTAARNLRAAQTPIAQTPIAQTPVAQTPIAIVGAGCRLPGAENLAAFWALLDQGIDAVTTVPADRFAQARYLRPKTANGQTEPGTSYTFAAGTIGDVSQFDPASFNLTPREAQEMDPQQRILLEVVQAAIEDAGWSARGIGGSRTGVFVGASSTDFWAGRYEDSASLDRYGMTGGAMSIMANRIAHVFDLHGAAQTVDTACSSSLVALHLACEALRTGQLSAAIVGGVNMLLAPAQFVGFSRASMLSPTGRCHAFDARADGYVRAEGAGAVVIKRLADALADGDHIRAVIRGTGTNSAGRTVGLSLPNGAAQAALLREVLDRSGLSPAQFAYFEAHGTGTLVGDPIEAKAISDAIARHPDRAGAPALPIGSVKTNIGHLESASGMAGLLKAMLVLEHRHIPRSLHFDTPNPNIPFGEYRLDVAGSARPLGSDFAPTDTAIGINSFGFGGTNGSAMLTAAPSSKRSARRQATALPPLLLSAHAPAALRGLAERWLGTLAEVDPADFPALLRGAARYRDLQPFRLVLRGTTAVALHQALASWLVNQDPNKSASGATEGSAARTQGATEGGVVLVYSGNGAQIPDMAHKAVRHNPRFRAALAKVDAVLAPLLGWSPLKRVRAGVTAAELVATDIAQPLLFAVQVAITETLRAEGIVADTVLGHSVGEVAAAWAAGLLDLPTAARLIVSRSAQQHRQRGIGRMAALGCPLDEALPALAEASAGAPPGSARLEIAAENGPRALTVAGPAAMLDRLEQIAGARRWSFIKLDLDYAFHSAAMDPVQAALVHDLADMQAHTPTARMVSTVSAAPLEARECNADYWWHNLRDRVRFRSAVHTAAAGARLFIEIGANPVLQSYLRETLQEAGTEARLLASLSRRDPPGDPFPALVDRAIAQGADPRNAAAYAGPADLRGLPLTPFARISVALARTSDATTIIAPLHAHRLLGFQRPEHKLEWTRRIDTALEPWLADHRFAGAAVLPAAGMAEMALAAAGLHWPLAPVLEVAELRLVRMLAVPDERGQDIRLNLTAEGGVLLSSRTHLSDESWAEHAIGQVGALTLIPAPADLPHNGRITISGAEIVAMAAKIGLDYGPAFQPIIDASIDPEHDTAIVRLALPAAAPDDDGFLLHPVRFDGALQGLIGLLAAGDAPFGQDGTGMVPSHIGRLLVLRNAAPPVLAEIAIRRRGSRSVVADIVLRDAVGRVVARAWDCWLQRAPLGRSQANPTPIFRFDLLPAFDHAADLPADVLPAARAALPKLSDAVNEAAELLRGCVLSAAFTAFAAEPGAVVRARSPYAQALLEDLASSQLAVPVADGWRLLHDAPLPDAGEIWRVVYADHPNLAPELAWIAEAIERLPTIVRPAPGEVGHIDHVMLPPEADTNRRMAAALARAAGAFATAWPAERPLRVLDLGGGRGDLLAALAASGRRVAHIVLHLPGDAGERGVGHDHGEPRGGAVENSSLTWDPTIEGTKLPPADLVVGLGGQFRFGAALLPAVRASLAQGGVFLVAEPIAATVWNFVGGQSASWWDGPGDANAVLMDAAGWDRLLASHGFQEPAVHALADLPLPAAIISARMPAMAPATVAAPEARPLVLLGRHGALRSALHAAVIARGGSCDLLDFATPPDPDRFQGRDVVILPPTRASSEGGLAEVLATICTLAQACADRASSLVLVTEGGQQSDIGPHYPAAAACCGMARVLANEFAPLRLRRIDLSPGLEPALAARRLASEILDARDDESEVVLTGSARLVPRMRRGLPPQGAALPARLVIRQPGQLGSLAWETLGAPAAPQAGELRIRVDAAGLNFRDVMWAQGLLPEDVLMHGYAGATLGMEAAGRVEAVGPGVGFAVGDRVFGFVPGAFASRVVVREDAVAAQPAELTAEQAATVPVTFMTAVYALETCARLVAGEKVLIHGGAGGVGLAAIQVAKAAGALVAASAGSRAKRAFLHQLGVDVVLDSRDLGFADTLRQTWPDGVDVVLNSLAGPFMDRSLGLVRPFGRFVELGKRDFVENRRAALRPMRQNVTYFAVDVDQLPLARPELAQRLLSDISARMASGAYRPLPATVFAHTDVETGFRMLQGSTHIGKIVIRPPQGPLPSHAIPALAADGTVVVVGGMQGFGLQAARKLAELGVRHLALISRRGGATEGAMEAIAGLAALGAEARVYACDATDANALAATLAAIRAQSEGEAALRSAGEKSRRQPIVGVVHAAAVLDDGAAASLTAERFAPVLAAKLAIAENLDRLTASDPLTLFLMFSSATTALGNPGQANYVAANAALGSLASRRRAAGRPALAIGWGPIEDVGILARDAATAETLRRRLGVDAMTAAEALAGLPILLTQTSTANPHYARVDWNHLADMLPLLGEKLFATLRGSGGNKTLGSRDMLERLRALAPAPAAELLREVVREEIGGILQLEPADLALDVPLPRLGLDSLGGMELRAALEGRLGIPVPLASVSDTLTIEVLVLRIRDAISGQQTEDAAMQSVIARHEGDGPSNEDNEMNEAAARARIEAGE